METKMTNSEVYECPEEMYSYTYDEEKHSPSKCGSKVYWILIIIVLGLASFATYEALQAHQSNAALSKQLKDGKNKVSNMQKKIMSIGKNQKTDYNPIHDMSRAADEEKWNNKQNGGQGYQRNDADDSSQFEDPNSPIDTSHRNDLLGVGHEVFDKGMDAEQEGSGSEMQDYPIPDDQVNRPYLEMGYGGFSGGAAEEGFQDELGGFNLLIKD